MIQTVTDIKDTLTKGRAAILKETDQYHDSVKECAKYRNRIREIEESLPMKGSFVDVENMHCV